MFTSPKSLEEKISQDISSLAEFLSTPDSVEPEKYAVFFQNEIFMMHPHCWCDDGDCPWCGKFQKRMEEFGAEKNHSAPNFWHKPSNTKIWWYKTIGRELESNCPLAINEWDKILKECKNSCVGL